MDLQKATTQATKHLLASKKARTYLSNNGQEYILDIVKDEYGLSVTTWGFDYDGFEIPNSRPHLISLKTKLQLRSFNQILDPVDQIALRYYLDILKRECN